MFTVRGGTGQCRQGFVHAHTTVGDEDFQTYSGHLAEGTVKPLLEVFVTPFPGELRRVHDPQRNLELLDLDGGA